MRIAEAGNCVLAPSLHGEFVPAGAPLFEIEGAGERVAVLRAIKLGLERTLDQDVAYGLRMLVDIAERSLSTVLSRSDDRRASDRSPARLPAPARAPAVSDGRYSDKQGEVRLITPSMTWKTTSILRSMRSAWRARDHRKWHVDCAQLCKTC